MTVLRDEDRRSKNAIQFTYLFTSFSEMKQCVDLLTDYHMLTLLVKCYSMQSSLLHFMMCIVCSSTLVYSIYLTACLILNNILKTSHFSMRCNILRVAQARNIKNDALLAFLCCHIFRSMYTNN